MACIPNSHNQPIPITGAGREKLIHSAGVRDTRQDRHRTGRPRGVQPVPDPTEGPLQ